MNVLAALGLATSLSVSAPVSAGSATPMDATGPVDLGTTAVAPLIDPCWLLEPFLGEYCQSTR